MTLLLESLERGENFDKILTLLQSYIMEMDFSEPSLKQFKELFKKHSSIKKAFDQILGNHGADHSEYMTMPQELQMTLDLLQHLLLGHLNEEMVSFDLEVQKISKLKNLCPMAAGKRMN